MRVLIVSFAIVFIDQITKLYIKGFSIPFLKITHHGMYEGERIQVIGNFFRITFIENPGMAFGFDPGINMKLWISLFSLVASIGLITYLYKIRNKSLTLRLAIAFILGGAVGNLIDRMLYGIFYHYAPLFYGRVVDFLDFDFFHFSLFGREYDRWPIFNIADAAVTIGVLILIIFYRKIQESDEKEESLAVENGTIEAGSFETESEIEQSESTTSSELNKEKKDSQDGETGNGKEISL